MVFHTFLEEISMGDFEKKIISELKQVLEFKEINSDYSQ